MPSVRPCRACKLRCCNFCLSGPMITTCCDFRVRLQPLPRSGICAMTSVRSHGDLIDDRNPAATRQARDFCAPTVSSFASNFFPRFCLPQSGTGRCGASGSRASRRASRSSSTRTCEMQRMRSARWTVRSCNCMNHLACRAAGNSAARESSKYSLLCLCSTSPRLTLQVCATGYQGWRVEFTRAGPRGSGPPGGGGGYGGGYGGPPMGYGGPPPSYYGMRGPARDQLCVPCLPLGSSADFVCIVLAVALCPDVPLHVLGLAHRKPTGSFHTSRLSADARCALPLLAPLATCA